MRSGPRNERPCECKEFLGSICTQLYAPSPPLPRRTLVDPSARWEHLRYRLEETHTNSRIQRVSRVGMLSEETTADHRGHVCVSVCTLFGIMQNYDAHSQQLKGPLQALG